MSTTNRQSTVRLWVIPFINDPIHQAILDNMGDSNKVFSASFPNINIETNSSKHTPSQAQVQVQVQSDLENFPFLSLPLEIRRMIYRYLLVSHHVVRRERIRINGLAMTPGRVSQALTQPPSAQAPTHAAPPPLPHPIGKIRCVTSIRDRLQYQTSILRVNRQIYQEASPIFDQENFWLFVRINKSGFGQQMKDLGFTAFPCADFSHIKHPVLSVNAQFFSLVNSNENDCFLMPTTHLKQLFRVLWTVVGTGEMMVQFQRFFPCLMTSPTTHTLLSPFLNLIGPKTTFLIHGPRYNDVESTQLYRPPNTAEAIEYVLYQMHDQVNHIEQCMEEGKWAEALSMSKDSLYFYTDAQLLYGYHLMPPGPMSAQDTRQRFLEPKSVTLGLLMCFAELALRFVRYPSCVRYCFMALNLMNWNNARIRDPYKSWIHTLRARAYAGQRVEAIAYHDFRCAAELRPDVPALAEERDGYVRSIQLNRSLGADAVDYHPSPSRVCPWVGTRDLRLY